MQFYANVGSEPTRKVSLTTQNAYWEFRACESQRGQDDTPTWLTVRVMKDADPKLKKGDFVKVTGKLKTDFFLDRAGQPSGMLLVIAFEAAKIAKPSEVIAASAASSSSVADHSASRDAAVVGPRGAIEKAITREPDVTVETRAPMRTESWRDIAI
jgi:hypothetical protein